MAAKKFYAVKKGKITGVFSSWEDCKASVDGVSGAEYKGFATRQEAEQYLGLAPTSDEEDSARNSKPKAAPGTLIAYVDGSYEDSLKKYAFGCVFITTDGTVYTAYGNGDNEKSLQHRNVTGEMLGAMYAVRTAMISGYDAIDIYFDYEGIEKWVTGAWKAKAEHTQKYAVSMREWGKSIRIGFHKVAAHTNVKYNELADKMAKHGLTAGQGFPKIRPVTELENYIED